MPWKIFFFHSRNFFFRQVFPRKNFFPSKSVCRTYLHWNHPYPFSPQKSNGRPFTWNSLGRIRELARCKLLTLVQKLCAENCAENCPHIYVTMHQLSRQCCGPKSRRCKSSCVASLMKSRFAIFGLQIPCFDTTKYWFTDSSTRWSYWQTKRSSLTSEQVVSSWSVSRDFLTFLYFSAVWVECLRIDLFALEDRKFRPLYSSLWWKNFWKRWKSSDE